jgi:hypothetical protein
VKDLSLPVSVDESIDLSRRLRSPEVHAVVPDATVDNECQLVSQLVAQVYEVAPVDERRRLLTHLLKPLGVLSLFALANGIFARIHFNSGWTNLDIRQEDVRYIQANDVVTLVNYLQQVSVHAVNSLTQVLGSSPVMTGSAAGAVLIAMLARRAHTRRATDEDDFDVALR